MASAHKNSKLNKTPTEGGTVKDADREERQPARSWTSVRDALVEALQRMRDVAQRRSDRRSVKDIDTVEESLRKLDDRILHHQLPLAVIRMALGDARLDALMIHSQLKIALMYDHQELLAPNEKLRAQFQEYRKNVHDDNDRYHATSTMTPEQAMKVVARDLDILAHAERLIREEGSGIWNASLKVTDSP